MAQPWSNRSIGSTGISYVGAAADFLATTGHPIITLYVASSEKDGAFYVYLEDVAADGQCRYVTEGVMRALHRRTSETPRNLKSVGPYRSLGRSDAELLTPGEATELCFDLIPTSWLFRKGHSIRIAVSAADRDHFSRIPGGRPPELTFYREVARASAIELPVIPRGS